MATALPLFDAELQAGLRLADGDDGDAKSSSKFPLHVLPPRVALARVRAMRQTDAPPPCNLASFVTTVVEPECATAIEEARTVNEIDAEEYPSMDAIRALCLSYISDLWHVPEDPQGRPPAGADTVGSSEAVLLAGMAAKRRWSERRRALGLPVDKPNIVLPTDAHVVWEKLSNYHEIEPKWVPSHPGEFRAREEDLAAAADENTVLIVAILGSTFTCSFYDIEKLDALVAAKNKARPEMQLGIHVDAASGGFVAPFATPELKWDFALDHVVSINASGHKHGQALCGIGWVLFRTPDLLPRSLVFTDAYLGAEQMTFTLNFSKSACGLVNQFFVFQRLGRAGYTALAEHMHRQAGRLRDDLLAAPGLGEKFAVISDPPPRCIPAVVFHLKDPPPGSGSRAWNEFDVAERVHLAGYVVPAYPLAPGNDKRVVLRVLCRQDFSSATRAGLVHALGAAVEWLEARHPPVAAAAALALEEDRGAKAQEAAREAAAKVAAAAARAAEDASAHPARVGAATLASRLLAATRLGLPLNRRGKC
jgi:glutamate decarboxylase